MVSSLHAHFSSRIEELQRMLLWIRKHLTDAGIDAQVVKKIELASEEAIVNVIQHAYENKMGMIELIFNRNESGIEISIVDSGPPFNPLLSAPSVNKETPLEEREAGGLGIFFLRKCVDDIRYRREGHSNILTLIKHFSRTK